MHVQCDNTECNRMFELTPDSIVTAISVDDEGEPIDWIPAEHVFACPSCLKQFAREIEGEDE